MSTLIRLEHLSAEVRLPDGERLTTVDDVSASFERGTSTAPPSSGNQDPAKPVSPPSSGCSTTTMTERSPMTGGTAPRGTTPTGRASAAGMSASCSRTTPSYRI